MGWSWKQTDDYQWVKCLSDNEDNDDYGLEFEIIDILRVELGSTESKYVVCQGWVNLDDYSRDEVEDIVEQYYPSFESMCNSYKVKVNESYKLNYIIAECIFENELSLGGCRESELCDDLEEAELIAKAWKDGKTIQNIEEVVL